MPEHDDDDEPTDIDHGAWDVAQRRLARQSAEGHRPGHVQNWLATTAANAKSELRAVRDEHPEMSIGDLVDLVEPPTAAVARNGRRDPTEDTAAAAAARYERDMAAFRESNSGPVAEPETVADSVAKARERLGR